VGKVYLVGAGPGDPELLTVKALRILGQAKVVLHDSLVSREVLAEASPQAEMVDVGKRCGTKLLSQEDINALLVAYASNHDIVVRLKGGDPLIFGRAAEEITALRDAGVPFEIVPGITAVLSAAAAAGISLSDRRVASQILITTLSHGPESCGREWDAINSATTVAIYMPGRDYGALATKLLDKGLSGDTPCAIVSHASSAGQEIRWTRIADLYEDARLPAPAILIVGKVAAQRAEDFPPDLLFRGFRSGEALQPQVSVWGKN
jgi:uroporphyrin-III C-methyltransferase